MSHNIDFQLEKKLGFDKIRVSITDRCSTEYARNKAMTESFSSDMKDVLERLSKTDEMKTLLMFESSFPDSGYHDCISVLKSVESAFDYIDLESLRKLKESLDTIRRILNFFSEEKKNRYPYLCEMASPVLFFPEVTRRMDTILDRFGEVRDNASEELRNIRTSIREKENIISRKIQSIMRQAQSEGLVEEDANLSVRDGHILIPVASGQKRKIQGIVYDESASGKTSFIEPFEVVELNNQMKELKFAERREIIRILTEFTEFLRPYIPDLISSYVFMGEIDFIRAKAITATRFQAGRPVISEEGELILKQARHPLLEETLKKEGKSIVPLNLTLNRDKRILLISGPNAGGKSVCLKTVGLLQYMFQWGLAVSASESSEMRLFDRIFIEIGDNQSIENDLSTYSSYLLNMKNILEKATKDSLILIDEFGSGTEPAAGGAIAEEILNEIENRGSYGVITTHYSNLKFYANNSNGVINGAMMFDVQKIQPLFELEIGLPGNSFAFELARKMGLPEHIIKGAEERAGTEFVNIERNLKKIARNKRSIDLRLQKIKATDRMLEGITEKYEKELTSIKDIREKLLEEAREEAAEIIRQANRKIENTIREIKECQAEKERTKELRNDLSGFKDKLLADEKNDTDLIIERKMEQLIRRKKRMEERKAQKASEQASGEGPANIKKAAVPAVPAPGVKVRIKANGLVGEIISVNADKLSVAVGNIISKMNISMVEIISSNEYKDGVRKAQNSSPASSSISAIANTRLDFNPRIDIRGKRLDEAISIVTKFIDDAQMLGMKQVSILHGKGDGILREEIRKYLKITPGVVSARDEHIQYGGSGITVVDLE